MIYACANFGHETLYPPASAKIVLRPRLIERLNEGLAAGRKLTLISAPAGFGKTTLVSEWLAGCGRPVAWLSLDEGDNDPARFLAYFIAALQTIAPKIGEGALGALHSPQPPPTEVLLTALLNDLAAIPDNFMLVLDDYHVIESKPVDEALTFLVDHLPPQFHLVIATREDPPLPLARLRARGQLTELRATDLRFTPAEAADFLNQVMGLNLSAADIAALETRTEGWIAGLQLAALSMQGRSDTASFIQAFTGSHRFVLDYLMEEVLQRQPERVRGFLLQTAILDRLSGPLCNAVTGQQDGKAMLETLERGNLFVIPLDDQTPVVSLSPPLRRSSPDALAGGATRSGVRAPSAGECMVRAERSAGRRHPPCPGRQGFRARRGPDRAGLAGDGCQLPIATWLPGSKHCPMS